MQAVLFRRSRTNAGALVDFSDYDVILAVKDIHQFAGDCWFGDFGSVLVVYRDPKEIYG